MNELETRISTLEGYAERMDTKFGGSFAPREDGWFDSHASPPDLR